MTDNWQQIIDHIAQLELRWNRQPGSVDLLAVSKGHPATAIDTLFAAGQRAFGENRLQDAQAKMESLAQLPIEWHFIGPIQSNKTRPIAGQFSWVHSIDQQRIAERLNDQRSNGLPALNVCIQVNISGEGSKSGISANEVLPLAAVIRELPRLRLRGLMAIPAAEEDFAAQRQVFAQVAVLQEQLKAEGHAVDTLSMGMSRDYEAAIAEGATLVRIGTMVFGSRS